MAKRKTRRAKKSKPSFMSIIPSEVKTLAYGFLYSAVIKEPTEKLTKNLTDNFGLNLTDNAVRIAGNVAGRRIVGKFLPQSRRIFDIGLGIEGAGAGQQGFGFLTDMFNGTSTPAAQTSATAAEQTNLNFY